MKRIKEDLRFTGIRLELTHDEYDKYESACRALASTMPKMATHLVKKFLSEFYASKQPLFKE